MITETAILVKLRWSVLALPLTLALVPMFLPWQWLSGPMVNFLLIISFYLLGYRAAVVLLFIPTLAAMASGIFPYPLWSLAPLIVLSNIILVTGFSFLSRSKHREKIFLFAFGPSFLKALFLVSSVSALSPFLTPVLLQTAQLIFAWPQFFTAASGSCLAYLFLRRYTASL